MLKLLNAHNKLFLKRLIITHTHRHIHYINLENQSFLSFWLDCHIQDNCFSMYERSVKMKYAWNDSVFELLFLIYLLGLGGREKRRREIVWEKALPLISSKCQNWQRWVRLKLEAGTQSGSPTWIKEILIAYPITTDHRAHSSRKLGSGTKPGTRHGDRKNSVRSPALSLLHQRPPGILWCLKTSAREHGTQLACEWHKIKVSYQLH